ncbi:MAG TPA: DUF4124 domain-containing protein [Rhodanobacteraceae bacterium]|nr:DUF4124 domain-containing protein [Rhodanobacteraceae bacterium]
MRIRVAAMIPLLLAACVVAQAGDYYKWTDAQGTVHYSQTPPPDRTSKSVYVDDGAPTPPLPGTGSAPQTPEQKAQAQSQQAALQSANKEAVSANCKAAQQNVANLQGRRMVVKSGDPDKARALDSQQREQALADAQKQVTLYCSPAK